MFNTNSFLIHLIIIISSIILSYIIYRYLNYDLIDISKIFKNDIEKFTQLDDTIFTDETAYPILEANTQDIQQKINNYLNKDKIDKELDRLKIYNRK